MKDAKIYGLCLERLKFQIENASGKNIGKNTGKMRIESYRTGDVEEIVDILELYDLEERTGSGLREKLEDLAYTASVLMSETLEFGRDPEGNFGLYLVFEPAARAVAG